jgi:hypothetical protein
VTFIIAGWSSPEAREEHSLEVVGSNPTPATNFGAAGLVAPIRSGGAGPAVTLARRGAEPNHAISSRSGVESRHAGSPARDISGEASARALRGDEPP